MRRFAFVWFSVALLAAPIRAQELPPDLAAVPGDAAGFIHVRVADIWKGDALKDIRKLIEKAGPEHLKMLDERFVPAPSSLDRATVIFWMPANPSAEMPFISVFTMSVPFDTEKLLKGALPNAKQFVFGEARFFEDESVDMALQVVNNRTILFGSRASVRQYVRKEMKPGGFEPALRSAAKRSLTVAVNPSLVPRELLAEIPPPLAPILKANLLHVGVELGKEAKIDLRLSYADEPASKDVEKAVQAGLGQAKQMLGEYKKQAEEKLFAKNKGERSSLEDLPEAAAALAALGFVNKVEEMLNDFPLRRDGSALAASVTFPEGPYTTAVSGVAVSAGLLLPAVQKVREAAARMKSSNNIKQISLSFHNYASAYAKLPTSAICDKNGKPLLSWRVTILPFIEQDNLYRKFKLDEPWDSTHNIKLIQQMPAVFAHPTIFKKHEFPSTYYQVFVGKGTIFQPNKGLTLEAITAADGCSNTIWLAEAEKAVPWTKPEDIEYDGKTLPKLAFSWNGRCLVGNADGSVNLFRKNASAKNWHAVIQWNDGVPVDTDDLRK